MSATISDKSCRSFRACARDTIEKFRSGTPVWEIQEHCLDRLLVCGVCAGMVDSQLIGEMMGQVADRADAIVRYLMREDDYGSREERARARKLRWYHANRETEIINRRERRRRQLECDQHLEA